MIRTSGSLILWAPRLLAIAVALFFGVFALDAFGGSVPLGESLRDFVIHLIPSMLLLSIVAVAWRRPWVGAVGFLILAIVYAGLAHDQRLDWTVVIAGPMGIVGLLFLLSWWHRTSTAAA